MYTQSEFIQSKPNHEEVALAKELKLNNFAACFIHLTEF
jgi:hypothetical protein